MKTTHTGNPRVIAARKQTNRIMALMLMVAFSTLLLAIYQVAQADDYRSRFYPVRPAHYIASLAEPDANSGNHAETWGYWPLDPGPRGVKLKNFDDLLAAGGVAPAKWLFDQSSWWIEENGLIMEPPEFPLKPGQYLVTGGREAMSVLTVYEADESGNQRWELERDDSIYDVTHLGCRSAVYTPVSDGQMCSPENVPQDVFRLTPDVPMPDVAGCNRQDYAVLIVVGLPITN